MTRTEGDPDLNTTNGVGLRIYAVAVATKNCLRTFKPIELFSLGLLAVGLGWFAFAVAVLLAATVF